MLAECKGEAQKKQIKEYAECLTTDKDFIAAMEEGKKSGNGDLTKCGEMVTDNAENFIKNNNVKAVVLFGTCLTKLPNMDTTKC